MTKKLAIKKKIILEVNWLTYSHDSLQGKCGLETYLAQCLKLDKNVELLGSPNDTTYSVDGHLSVHDKEDFWVKERSDLLGEIKKNGNVESDNMNPLILMMVEREWLPEAHYVICMSW